MKFIKNKLAVTVILLSVSFLIIIGLSVGRNNATFAESGFGLAINEFEGKVYNFFSGSISFFDSIANYNNTKKENDRLKKQNSQLLNMQEHYKTIQEANDNYRQMLAFENTREDYQYKGADIIKRPSGDWIDSLIINLGSDNGVGTGMIAVDKQGCLVGKVTYVAKKWARVETIVNSNINVSAIVSGSSNDNGIVKSYRASKNKMMCSLNFLPIDSKAKNGDVIITRGLDQSYPDDIRIGTVTDVQEEKGKMAKTAIIKPYADFKKLTEVAIVIPRSSSDNKY